MGDQPPLDTVRRIGDLLQDLDKGAPADHKQPPDPCAAPPHHVDPEYYPFREEQIRINVRPTIVREPKPTPRDSGVHGPFHAWVNSLTAAIPRDNIDEIPNQFMRGQLRCYHGEKPEDTYETIRLEGTRAGPNRQPERDVHIYELYWADLSRLRNSVFSILAEFYQLLFHLSSLGTHAVDAAAAQLRTRAWTQLQRWQAAASWVLTVPIPCLNLIMLGVAAVVLMLSGLRKTAAPGREWLPFGIIAVALATALLGVIGWLLWRRKTTFAEWIAPVAFWFALVAAGAWAAMEFSFQGSWVLFLGSVPAAAIAGGAVYLLARAYDRRRSGALRAGSWLCSGLVAAPVTMYFVPTGSSEPAFRFWVREFEIFWAGLFLSWVVFCVCSVAVWLVGSRALAGLDSHNRDLAERTRWTGRLMLALPAFAFLSATVVVWAVIAESAKKLVFNDDYLPALTFLHSKTIDDLMDQFLQGPFEGMLPILLLVAAGALVPAFWGLAPIVWGEVFPSDKTGGAEGSAACGNWLTRAFSALRLSGRAIYIAVTFLFPLGAAVALRNNLGPWFTSHPALFRLGVGSGALFAVLMLVRGKLGNIVLGFRTVLDVALDVDSWLREQPLDSNPTARICGRYASLLRYVCNWQSGGAHYDALVIIAHSQGTIITADMLRFLHWQAEQSGGMKQYDPELARLGKGAGNDRLPVYLFTMGNPLRQLYGLRFPYLYRYGRHSDSGGPQTWIAGDLPDQRRPHPEDLGVDRWVNAFRSGDYVGRHLWRTDDTGYLWTPAADCAGVHHPPVNVSSDTRLRTEFCIGAGAHTHYWDSTAMVIARELDSLVESA